MTVNTYSITGITSAVWAAVTRTITGFGATAIIALSGIPGSCPAASSVTLRPPVGQWWHITVAITAGAAGTCEIQLEQSASTDITVLTVAAGQTGGFTFFADRNTYPVVKNNDAVNVATIHASGFAMVA